MCFAGSFAAYSKGFLRLLSGILTTGTRCKPVARVPGPKHLGGLGRTRTLWRVVPVQVNPPVIRVVNEGVPLVFSRGVSPDSTARQRDVMKLFVTLHG